MDISFVNPASPFLISDKGAPALGELYLASICRNAGFNVKVIDLTGVRFNADYFGQSPKEFIPECTSEFLKYFEKSDVYAITATSAQYDSALNFKTFVNFVDPHAKVIIGGSHVSALPEEASKDCWDLVVTGEADLHIVELIQNIDKIKKGTIFNCIAPRHLDLIPLPARDLIDLKSYCANLTVGEGLTCTIHMSRGCSFKCSYCVRTLGDAARLLRVRSIPNIASEIQQIRDNYGIKRYVATDDIWGVKHNWTEEFCNRFYDSDYHFRVNCRANTLHFDLLPAMKKAGVDVISFGYESGSEKVLESISKNNIELNTKSVIACHETGINVKAYMIAGFAEDDEHSFEESKRWIEEAKPDSVQWSWLIPLPGTPIYQDAIKQGWKPNYSELYHMGKGARGSMNRLPWHTDQTAQIYEDLVLWTENYYCKKQDAIDCPLALSNIK